MFLHVSVILLTGGGGGVGGLRRTPPAGRTPPGRETPRDQAHPLGKENPPRPGRTPPAGRPPQDQAPPPRTRQTPPLPPPGRRLQHTVNERPVRILLECILVACELLGLRVHLRVFYDTQFHFRMLHLLYCTNVSHVMVVAFQNTVSLSENKFLSCPQYSKWLLCKNFKFYPLTLLLII